MLGGNSYGLLGPEDITSRGIHIGDMSAFTLVPFYWVNVFVPSAYPTSYGAMQ